MSACVRECVHACVRASVRVCVCMCVCVCVYGRGKEGKVCLGTDFSVAVIVYSLFSLCIFALLGRGGLVGAVCTLMVRVSFGTF